MDKEERTTRKLRQGLVVSDKTDKTVIVAVERLKRHALYGRVQRVTKRYHVHDQDNDCHEGDRIEIMECRPLSRLKRWRVSRVLQRAR